MTQQSRKAMAFYHEKGLVPAFNMASRYAGPEGRVGTLPDVIAARLATPPSSVLSFNSSNPTPWDQYYTTTSAEFLGLSKGGRKILIVAHGVGPLATLPGMLAAYKHEYGDKNRQRRGGRISAEEFLKLESGAYGDVAVVDFEEYVRQRESRGAYPFMTPLRTSEVLQDPVLRARIGPHLFKYVVQHMRYAFQYYKERHGLSREDAPRRPIIIDLGDANNCSYVHTKIEEGQALAHLLSIGQINNVHYSRERFAAWACNVACHEWWNGTRFIGVPPGAASIVTGPEPRSLLLSHWRELMEPSGLATLGGFHVLMQLPDKTWFTQVDKAGDGMDTYEPEFPVLSIEKVGPPVRFSTDIRHYHGFFKYDKREVRAVLPREANAYTLVGEPENVWEGGNPVRQICAAQGYRTTIDPTRRLVRARDLANDYARLMALHQAA